MRVLSSRAKHFSDSSEVDRLHEAGDDRAKCWGRKRGRVSILKPLNVSRTNGLRTSKTWRQDCWSLPRRRLVGSPSRRPATNVSGITAGRRTRKPNPNFGWPTYRRNRRARRVPGWKTTRTCSAVHFAETMAMNFLSILEELQVRTLGMKFDTPRHGRQFVGVCISWQADGRGHRRTGLPLDPTRLCLQMLRAFSTIGWKC